MYYTLPIEIDRNRRLHCCKLTHHNEKKKRREFVYSFVIGRTPYQRSPIFDIETSAGSRILQSSEGYDYDKGLNTKYSFEWKLLENKKEDAQQYPYARAELILHIGTDKVSKNKIIECDKTGLLAKFANNAYQISVQNSNRLNNCPLQVEIRFYPKANEGTYYTDTLLFYCVAAYDCVDLALDFGSDASQAKYKQMGRGEEESYFIDEKEEEENATITSEENTQNLSSTQNKSQSLHIKEESVSKIINNPSLEETNEDNQLANKSLKEVNKDKLLINEGSEEIIEDKLFSNEDTAEISEDNSFTNEEVEEITKEKEIVNEQSSLPIHSSKDSLENTINLLAELHRFYADSYQTLSKEEQEDLRDSLTTARSENREDDLGYRMLDSIFTNPPSEVILQRYQQYEAEPGNPLLKTDFHLNFSKISEDIQLKAYSIEKPSLRHPVEVLSLKQRSEDKENLLQIPNTKLMALGNMGWFQEQIGRKGFTASTLQDVVKRSLINQILHACFHQIKRELLLHEKPSSGYILAVGNAENRKLGVRICLLVPNVYPQEQVYSLIRQVYADAAHFFKKYDIGCIEVSIMSESDSALAGYLSGTNSQRMPAKGEKPPKYLALDAGRGTLDLSIVEAIKGGNHELRTLYRAGIAGAGQFLSFAFFEAVVHNYIRLYNPNNEEAVLWFLKQHETFQPDQKKKFWELITNLKINHCVDINNQNPSSYKTTGIRPQSSEPTKAEIAAFIEEVYSDLDKLVKSYDGETIQVAAKKRLPDIHNSIRTCLAAITNQVEEMLRNSGIMQLEDEDDREFYQVVLTGRTFGYPPLRKAIEELLVEKLKLVKDKKRIVFDMGRAKTVSLDGALQSAYKFNFSTDIIGALLVKSEVKTETNSWGDKIGEFITRIENAFKRWRNIPIVEVDEETGLLTTLFKLNKDFYMGLSENSIYVPKSNDLYYIGNLNYTAGLSHDTISSEDIEQETRLRIDIEQKGYVLRYPKDRTSIEFIYNKSNQTMSDFVLKSIFPLSGGQELIKLYKANADQERRKKEQEAYLSSIEAENNIKSVYEKKLNKEELAATSLLDMKNVQNEVDDFLVPIYERKKKERVEPIAEPEREHRYIEAEETPLPPPRSHHEVNFTMEKENNNNANKHNSSQKGNKNNANKHNSSQSGNKNNANKYNSSQSVNKNNTNTPPVKKEEVKPIFVEPKKEETKPIVSQPKKEEKNDIYIPWDEDADENFY